MSVYVSTWVWKHSKATGPTLVVALALADVSNDDGVSWYGKNKLSEKCRYRRIETLTTHINKLIEMGELSVVRRKNDESNTNETNAYVFTAYRKSENLPSDEESIDKLMDKFRLKTDQMVVLGTPEIEGRVPPKQGVGVPPKQGVGVPPKQGVGVPPKQGGNTLYKTSYKTSEETLTTDEWKIGVDDDVKNDGANLFGSLDKNGEEIKSAEEQKPKKKEGRSGLTKYIETVMGKKVQGKRLGSDSRKRLNEPFRRDVAGAIEKSDDTPNDLFDRDDQTFLRYLKHKLNRRDYNDMGHFVNSIMLQDDDGYLAYCEKHASLDPVNAIVDTETYENKSMRFWE